MGEPPRARVDAQVDVYRSYAGATARSSTGATTNSRRPPNPARWWRGLLDALRESGCDVLNLRVHVPGVPAEVVREQIVRIGRDVGPGVRAGLAVA